MFCSKCGYDAGDAKFCAGCGSATVAQEVTEVQTVPPQTAPFPTLIKHKKKRGCVLGVLIPLVAFVVLVIVLANTVGKDSTKNIDSENSEYASADLLAFDERSWEGFKSLYVSHNNFMSVVDKYGAGTISELAFYEKCVEARDYFRNMAGSFGYGKTQDEITYLSVLSGAALSDQMAAQDFIKYIDNKKTSDLSSAKTNIQNAKEAITLAASNRGVLLAKSDLTEDEIKQRIEAGMAGLE